MCPPRHQQANWRWCHRVPVSGFHGSPNRAYVRRVGAHEVLELLLQPPAQRPGGGPAKELGLCSKCEAGLTVQAARQVGSVLGQRLPQRVQPAACAVELSCSYLRPLGAPCHRPLCLRPRERVGGATRRGHPTTVGLGPARVALSTARGVDARCLMASLQGGEAIPLTRSRHSLSNRPDWSPCTYGF